MDAEMREKAKRVKEIHNELWEGHDDGEYSKDKRTEAGVVDRLCRIALEAFAALGKAEKDRDSWIGAAEAWADVRAAALNLMPLHSNSHYATKKIIEECATLRAWVAQQPCSAVVHARDAGLVVPNVLCGKCPPCVERARKS